MIVRADDGHARATRAAATRCPTRRCSSGCSSGSTRAGPRSCASCARRSTSTAARPWTVEVAVWDLVGAGARRAAVAAARRPLGAACSPTPRAASSSTPEERARRVVALRDAGVRAVKLRFHHADWRDDVAVVEAVRDAVGADVELMVDANHGWRMAGRPRAALGRRRRRSQCARALEPLGVYWLEEPLPTARRRRLRAPARRHRRCGSRPARWCAALHEARDLRAARRRRRHPARRRARRRARRLPPDRGAGRPVRAHVLAAHVVERARAARQPAPRAGRLDVPVRRGAATTRRAGRPERRDWLLGGAGRRDRRRRHDRAAARARPRRRRPTSTRSRRTASA